MIREQRKKKKTENRTDGCTDPSDASGDCISDCLESIYGGECRGGNELYSSEQIEQLVLNDEYSWNSLYVLLKYRIRDTGKVPFVDTMEVTLDDPHTVHVLVYEKEFWAAFTLMPSGSTPILTRMDSSWRLLRTRLRMCQRSPE